MQSHKRRDGFLGEKQINVPKSVLSKFIIRKAFINSLFITHIGYFPKALYHYRERKNGCDDYILFYSLGGTGYIDNPKEKIELASNQFIIIPPHIFHRYQADLNDPWTIYWVHFSSNKLKEFGADFNIERFYKPTDIQYNDQIINTWIEMYSSLDAGYNTENIGFANLCLYRFISFFLFPNKKVSTKEPDSPLDKSITYMKENISRRLTTEDIAEKFNYSPSHYTAIFKQKTGMSPIDYYIKLKIKEISDKIGYDDPYYFSRLFKQIMGKSPKEYRKVS